MSQEPARKLNPLALSVDEASRVLSASGPRPISPEQLRTDIDDGAPVNADGTINLIHYSAWLIKEMASAN